MKYYVKITSTKSVAMKKDNQSWLMNRQQMSVLVTASAFGVEQVLRFLILVLFAAVKNTLSYQHLPLTVCLTYYLKKVIIFNLLILQALYVQKFYTVVSTAYHFITSLGIPFSLTVTHTQLQTQLLLWAIVEFTGHQE